MKKKFICPICGYVHEGEEAPERCPQCKQIVEWKVVDESAALNFVTEHVVGIAKGTGEDMIKDLNAHFMGEATEVGMYLAMSRQADREGYPEIAEAFKRYAFEEAEHCAKFAELLGDVVWDTKTNLYKRMIAECGACEDKMRIARVAGRCGVGHQDQPLQAHDCRMRCLRRQDAHRPRCQGAQPRRHPRHRPRDGQRRSPPR